jgi:hypothetical protein
MMAPAPQSRSTINALWSGTQFSKAFEPRVVRFPFVGVKSLMATGMPCNGPTSSPRTTAASASLACAKASSAKTKQKQFNDGLTSSIRARLFSMISTGEISFLRTNAASSAAGV